jgi:hypothetical protein
MTARGHKERNQKIKRRDWTELGKRSIPGVSFGDIWRACSAEENHRKSSLAH